MAKSVFKNPIIILGGVDVSNYVQRILVMMEVGHLNIVELTLLDNPNVITITEQDERGNGGYRLTRNSIIQITGGDNISDHISRYDLIRKAGDADLIRLHIQADSDTITINGVAPWERQATADSDA